MTINTAIKSLEVIGATFYLTDTSQQFALGQLAKGDNGTVWIYVKASSAIKQFDCCSIDENYNAASLTNANAKKGYKVGWAQQSGGIASASFGWLAMTGSGFQGRVKGILNHSSKVYSPATSSGSAGVLRTSATGRIKIQGIVTVTTSSGSNKSPELEAAWPVLLN
jgi:hypothetical protein